MEVAILKKAQKQFLNRTVTEAERGTMSDLSYRANEGCKQKTFILTAVMAMSRLGWQKKVGE